MDNEQKSGITGDYKALEAALAEHPDQCYVLRLFVTGGTFISLRAIANARRIFDQYLNGNYELTVVDLRQQPDLCAESHIVAAPTLVKEQPAPVQRIVGDMSDTQLVLTGLGISRSASHEQP